MDQIRKKVLDIICEQFSVSENEITDETGPGDLVKWDSIGQLRLIMELEKEFNIQLSVDDLMSINKLRDIINTIRKLFDIDEVASRKIEPQTMKSMAFHPLIIPSKTYWGKNSISVLKTLNLNQIAIIIGSSKYTEKIIDKIKTIMDNDNDFHIFQRAKGEPVESNILKLSEQLNKFSPKHIIAIGGGSTIDIAKLSWLLYEQPDFQLNKVDGSLYDLNLRKKSYFTAIPTTFGSGSEVSSAAAFTKENDFGKSILISHQFIPNQVILDPLLGKSAKLETIYSSAFDALTHVIEGYVSIIKHPMLEPIAVSVIKNIIQTMKKIMSEGINIDLLEVLCYSAYYAGIIQNHCSVGLTHSFAHQLGHYGVSHGTANAMFLIPVIDYNSGKIDKYNNLAIELGLRSITDLTDDINILLNESSIMPNKEIITKIINDKPMIITGAMNDITFRTNPVILDQTAVESVFDNVMEGY